MAQLASRSCSVALTFALILCNAPNRQVRAGDCPAPPTPIAVGQYVEGTLSATDCIDPSTNRPVDRYTFEAVAGRHYTVAFNTKPLFAQLTVFDPTGALAAEGASESLFREHAAFQAAMSGTYTIVGTGTGAPGAVPSQTQVWVRDEDEPCNGIATPIADGQTLSGALEVTDCYGLQMEESFTDLYTFTALAGGEYTITMRSSAVDALLALRDPSGAVVTWNNNGAGGSDARMVLRPPATGVYTIEASSYDLESRSRDGFGAYTVSLQSFFCQSQTSTIAPGQTLGGTLSTTDCPSPHRPPWFDHYFDTFTFAATPGTTYEIILAAAGYDPYVYLIGPSGAVLAENNDGGGGWNSRIVFTPQVAGIYVIEATSYYYHQTGPYSVSLATSTPCTSANQPIASGDVVDGALSTTDCYSTRNPDAFYDRYTFAATAGTEYTISAEASDYYVYVELRDPAGRVVYREGDYLLTNGLTFVAEAYFTGTYTIEISSAHDAETGPYQLSMLADANASCTLSTSPVVADTPVAGTLSVADCYGTLRDHAYHDRYTFSGTAGDEFTITMGSDDFDAFLGLYGPDGALVDSDDDGGNARDAKLEVTLPATGAYRIEATSYWSTETGAYEVELVTGIERCISTVVALEVGETFAGELGLEDCNGAYYPSSFADSYTFHAEPDTTYAIRMSSPGFSLDPSLALFNSSGSLLATDLDSGPGLDARILFTSGVDEMMTVEAAASHLGAQTGPYVVSVAVYNGEDDCVPPESAIFPDEPISQELTTSDCISVNRPYCYYDLYAFEATPDVVYTIDMTSDGVDPVDPWLILVGPDGEIVEQDDDSGNGVDAQIVFSPPAAGTYTIETTTYINGDTGNYQISLSADEPAAARGACAAAAIKAGPGQRVRNAVTVFDCFAPERSASRNDRYTFQAVAGARYVVTLESGEFDSFLLLVDPSGAIVAENNDSGGKLDAKLDFVAAVDGLYTIVATTNQPGATGRYDLAVAGYEPSTLGVYVASSGAWFLRNTNTPGPGDAAFVYGPSGAGWHALAADWNGDGSATVGLYDPVTGAFFLRNTNAPGAADLVFHFGAGGSFVPIVGDWDGDGTETVGIYDPSSGAFFLENSNAPGPADLVFTYGAGGAGLVPLVGDWNGDGTDTVGLYDPSSGAFFLRNANAPGAADLVYTFGAGGQQYVPIAGDWNANGVDTVGLYDPATSTFLLRNAHAGGVADVVAGYGPAGSAPVMGAWRGR